MTSTTLRTTLAAMLCATAIGSANAATLNLLDLGNRLIRVDTATPGTIGSTVALTGLRTNETIVGFDYRPASSRVLYGLGSGGQLYAINPLTGGAAAIGAPVLLNGTGVGVDFNPSVDRIRVVTNANQNLRLNPDTGALAATDTPLAYAAGDAGFGTAPRVVAAAYSNNVAGGTPTTLYVIDVNRGVLATQGSAGGTISPNGGQLFTVGSLGVASNDTAGFDIARDGTVYATLTAPGGTATRLYTINLATGAATLVGTIGAGTRGFLGLAVAPVAVSTFGATVNQTNIGTTLDNFVGVPGAGLNAFFNSFDGLSGGQADALSQLTPAAYTLLPELSLRTVEFAQDNVQRYLRDFRDGATGRDGSGRAMLGNTKLGLWMVGSGRDGHYDGAVDRPRVDYGAVGMVGGIDFQVRDQLLVGVMGGYDEAFVDLSGNTRKSAIQSAYGGAYATARFGPAYVDVFGTYGEQFYALRRAVRFGGTTSLDFQSSMGGKTYVGGGTVGASLKFGGAVLEPFAGARYVRLKIEGFNEGNSFGALGIGRTDYESVLGNFGAKLGGDFAVGSVRVRPEIRGAYRHEFRKDRYDGFGYTFAGTGSTVPIGFTPTGLRRNYYTGGAGFTVSGANSPISLVVDYNGEYAKDRNINGITGGFRFAF